MDFLSMVIFSFYMAFSPNPHDHHKPHRIPFSISIQAFRQASIYANVEPEEVTAVVSAEHGGKAKSPRYPEPYPSDSVGKDDERGLMQVSDWERKRFNWCQKEGNAGHKKYLGRCGVMVPTGERYSLDELFDPSINIIVGTFALHRIKHVHPRVPRCRKGTDLIIKTGVFEMQLDPLLGREVSVEVKARVHVEPFHNWHAHYRCGRKTRGLLLECVAGSRCHKPVVIEGRQFTRACKTRWRAGLVVKLSKWKRIALWENPLPPSFSTPENQESQASE